MAGTEAEHSLVGHATSQFQAACRSHMTRSDFFEKLKNPDFYVKSLFLSILHVTINLCEQVIAEHHEVFPSFKLRVLICNSQTRTQKSIAGAECDGLLSVV